MPRRYSEEEAQRIFALVAERQRTAPGPDGLSLAELEEAAAAAGLDPSLVAVAAAELEAAPRPEQTLAGAPFEVVRSRVVAGPLGDDAWAEAVAEARREFGQPGTAGQVGRLREWTLVHKEDTGNNVVTRLAAEPAGDGVRLTVSRSVRAAVRGFSFAAAVNAAAALLFVVLGFVVEPALWIPAALMAGGALLFGGGVQVGSRVWHRSERARLEGLLDRLERTTRAAADAWPEREPEPRMSEPGPSPARAPVLDLDALGDVPDDGAPASRPRLRS